MTRLPSYILAKVFRSHNSKLAYEFISRLIMGAEGGYQGGLPLCPIGRRRSGGGGGGGSHHGFGLCFVNIYAANMHKVLSS